MLLPLIKCILCDVFPFYAMCLYFMACVFGQQRKTVKGIIIIHKVHLYYESGINIVYSSRWNGTDRVLIVYAACQYERKHSMCCVW